MARFPFLNADGTFQSAQVKTQLDARTDARMRDRLPTLAEELGIGATGVPIFATLAEAEEWEAAHPGKTARTIESVTPDTTAPAWPAGTAIQVVKTDTTATLNLTQLATDDRRVVAYEVSLDSGVSWLSTKSGAVVFDAASKSLKVSGLARSTQYPAPRVRALDAAGNVSAVLTGSAGFTTDAAPPVAYQQTALALNPLHFYAGTGNTNLGTYGAHTASTRNSGTATGAALAGFPSSYSMTGNQKMQFESIEGMTSQSAWSWACVFRLKSASTGGQANDSVGLMATPAGDAPTLGKSPTDATAPFTFTMGSQAFPQSPLTDPYNGTITFLVGVDFDAAVSDQATVYVNGKVHTTFKSTPTGSANRFIGPQSSSTYGRLTASVDWAGLVVHTKPLGAAAHLQLAKDAGVYVA